MQGPFAAIYALLLALEIRDYRFKDKA